MLRRRFGIQVAGLHERDVNPADLNHRLAMNGAFLGETVGFVNPKRERGRRRSWMVTISPKCTRVPSQMLRVLIGSSLVVRRNHSLAAEFTAPLLPPPGKIIFRTYSPSLMRFRLTDIRPLEVLFHA